MKKEQVLKIADFLACNCDGHAICRESLLEELAKETGLSCSSPSKKLRRLVAADGTILANVMLHHQNDFQKEIASEGRGGRLAVGDWFGFSAGALVDTLAYSIAGYRSHKNGRGSRFWDCVEAIKAYAEKL